MYNLLSLQPVMRSYCSQISKVHILSLLFLFQLVFLANEVSYHHTEEAMDSICDVLNSEHIDGVWVKTEFSSNETWPCCGWDDDIFLRYPQECGTSPMHKVTVNELDKTISFVGTKEFFAHSGNNGCSMNCSPIIGRMISARWMPSECKLPEFDAAHFCNNVLRDRSVLVIGDSTMQQTASVLMNAVHYHCPERIRFVIADTLVGRAFGKMNRGQKWSKSVRTFNPDIVLIGAGAHIHTERGFHTVIQEVYNDFINEFSDKILIWKTVNPGGIPKFTILEEIPDLTDPEIFGKWESFGYLEKWRWDLFPLFDRIAKQYFREKGVPVLDVEPLYYRSDNHPRYSIDLHHCTHGNGALRLIPRLLQSLLEQINLDPT